MAALRWLCRVMRHTEFARHGPWDMVINTSGRLRGDVAAALDALGALIDCRFLMAQSPPYRLEFQQGVGLGSGPPLSVACGRETVVHDPTQRVRVPQVATLIMGYGLAGNGPAAHHLFGLARAGHDPSLGEG